MARSDVRGAVEIALRQLRDRPKDPPIGLSRDMDGQAVRPGEWSPDLYGLPPDCPVDVLGKEGELLHIVDTSGQFHSVAPGQFGQAFIEMLFGDRQNYLYWAWPSGEVAKTRRWKAEMVRRDFFTAGARRGLFSPLDKVRGRGAWADRHGVLVWHSGDALWRSDQRLPARARAAEKIKPLPTGWVDSHYYPACPPVVAPWPEAVPVEDNPARAILTWLNSWNWERPDVDPILFLGWLAAAFLGGALEWRPAVFVSGDAATGKSTLQALVKTVVGDALLQTSDTTKAGIYQLIRQDSLPVAVDEMEAEADIRRAVAVIELVRIASSGSTMLRGGADHAGVQFRARNTFLLSGINAPALQPAEVSRFAMLRLRKLENVRGLPAPLDADTTGPKLLRRLLDEWKRFPQTLAAYKEVLREAGHDGRGQDTLGTLLACADLAIGADLADQLRLPMVDDLKPWGERLAPTTMLEYEDRAANWLGCLRHLLTSRVEAWRAGNRQTIGAVLEELEHDKKGDFGVRDANALLEQAGVKVFVPGHYGSQDDGWVLAVPHESQLVASLFRDTKWCGAPGASVWKGALRQAPDELLVTPGAKTAGGAQGHNINKVRINGIQVRCTMVKMGRFQTGDW